MEEALEKHEAFVLTLVQTLQAFATVEPCASWGVAATVGAAARKLGVSKQELEASERPIEVSTSHHIGAMPFLWLDVPDEPGPASARGRIERNAIGLLSNSRGDRIDPASAGWLGRVSNRPLVRQSGLWNQNHVDDDYDRTFLADLNRFVEETIACR